MKEFVIDEKYENQRIDKYLKKILSKASTSLIYKMIRKKDTRL
jgi:23S rRNA pseudouridine955/2504/2580 synthase